MKLFRSVFVVAIIAFAASHSTAQENERERAIKRYLVGNDIEAILSLEALVKQKQYAADAELMNYLGLAYQNTLDAKNARKMFEKAVKLRPDYSTYRANLAFVYLLARQLNKSQEQAKKALQLDPSSTAALFVMGTADLWEGKRDDAMATAEKALRIDATFVAGYTLKADVLIAELGAQVANGSTVKEKIELLRLAVEVLETGVKNSPPAANRTNLLEKLEGAKVFYQHYSKDRTPAASFPPTSEPGVTPVKITYKPAARYTDSGRSAGVSGTIRLAILLGANGKVGHILKLKGLGYGLDEQAIRAARSIRFEPKTKDGLPVSTVVTIEYSFSIY